MSRRAKSKWYRRGHDGPRATRWHGLVPIAQGSRRVYINTKLTLTAVQPAYGGWDILYRGDHMDFEGDPPPSHRGRPSLGAARLLTSFHERLIVGGFNIWLGLVFAIWFAVAPAQASEQRRVALVVGVSAYGTAPPLRNPVNDATDLTQTLRELGFEVTVVVDPGKSQLRRSLTQFARTANGADAALFYYAGHAVQSEGHNHLLGTDSNPQDAEDLYDETIDMERVKEALSAAELRIIILDACRNNPFASRFASRTRALQRGLAPLPPSQSEVVVFSAAAGEVAEDGDGRNSPFASALLRHITEPGVELGDLLLQVTGDVKRASNGKQRPSVVESRDERFFFVPRGGDPRVLPASLRPAEPPRMAAPVANPDGSLAVAFPNVPSSETGAREAAPGGGVFDMPISNVRRGIQSVAAPAAARPAPPRAPVRHSGLSREAPAEPARPRPTNSGPPATPRPADDVGAREAARRQLIDGWGSK